jgi:DNA-binding NarL/FixJ family response regulator
MRIIFAARETDLRLASQLLLSEEPNVNVVGTASTVSGVLALLETYQVDIVILDSELSTRKTSEWISEIKNYTPKTQIILLGSKDQHPQVPAELGVDAFIDKTVPADHFISAFRQVVAKRNCISNQVKENTES